LYIILSPLTSSKRSWMRSLSRKLYIKGVPKRPISVPKAPMNMKWLAIRFSSARMTRMYSALSGTSMPPSLSTAMA